MELGLQIAIIKFGGGLNHELEIEDYESKGFVVVRHEDYAAVHRKVEEKK